MSEYATPESRSNPDDEAFVDPFADTADLRTVPAAVAEARSKVEPVAAEEPPPLDAEEHPGNWDGTLTYWSEKFIVSFLGSHEFECAANEIVRARRQGLEFSPRAKKRIIAAMQDGCLDALEHLPQSYPMERISLGFTALAALVDPDRVRKRGKRAYGLMWDLACIFRSDLETLRRAERLRELGIFWAPPAVH